MHVHRKQRWGYEAAAPPDFKCAPAIGFFIMEILYIIAPPDLAMYLPPLLYVHV